MEKTIKILSTEALRQKLLSAIDGYLQICKDNSISVGLYHKGNLYVLSSDENPLNLQYDIGSVSKTITAHLILSLCEKGLIELHKSISEYISLPSGEYPTVYELLTHTAGYGHLTPAEITVPSLLRSGYAKRNIYESCTESTVLKCLSRRKKRTSRRGKYGYSDFSYSVLALIAESVSNQPFASLLETFIDNSLGLAQTTIEADENLRMPKPAKRGHKLRFWKWYRENPYIAGGGLVSTVYDMLKYIKLEIESKERYISGAHKICMSTVSEKRNEACCIGWHTYKKSNQLWHVGGVGTFRSSIIFNKKRGLGVVVLGNAKGIRSANVHYIAKMIYSEMKINKIDFSRIVI